MSIPSSHSNPLINILTQPSQGTKSLSHQILPPPPQTSHISTNSTTQQSQTSFENAINELDAEL